MLTALITLALQYRDGKHVNQFQKGMLVVLQQQSDHRKQKHKNG